MRHRAYVYDRGGEQRIGEIWPLTQVRWGRVRDDTSSGNIFARSPDRQCHRTIAEIEPNRHELVVFRDGQRVWEGPILRHAEKGAQVEVDARDITHYLNRTIMRAAYDNAYPKTTFAVKRIENILLNELARKEAMIPSYNLLKHLDLRIGPTDAKTSRSTAKYEKYVFEELDAMAAKGGIDYTTIGRRLVVNDTHANIGQGPLLTEAAFDGDLSITAYGAEGATISAVTDGEGRYAVFGGVDPYYGEVELLHTIFEEAEAGATNAQVTQAEMVTQAQRNMSGRYPVPVVLKVPENSTLRPERADALMDYLVPGVRFLVRATNAYRQISQEQKLDKVTFTETAKGESITVSMSPAPGVTPWDDSGETGDDT